MSEGSTGSGGDLVSGRANLADGSTKIWAKTPDPETGFFGEAILHTETLGDVNSPGDLGEEGADDGTPPMRSLIGTISRGWSGTYKGPCTGLVARGGKAAGTGVVGLGGGVPEPGGANSEGGIGIQGLGGSKLPRSFEPTVVPGAGVVGQGGRQDDFDNQARIPHAAGVIGIGGGNGRKIDLLPLHDINVTGGAGVYGQGADLAISLVPPLDADGKSVCGPSVPSGPLNPGAGVVGRGGAFTGSGPGIRQGDGVVGVAGGVPFVANPQGAGVIGNGKFGVVGLGAGLDGRGGRFEADWEAQVILTPRQIKSVLSDKPAYPTMRDFYTAVPPLSLPFPKDGQPGDLLSLMDAAGRCDLYLCTMAATKRRHAIWQQVLLGAPIVDDAFKPEPK